MTFHIIILKLTFISVLIIEIKYAFILIKSITCSLHISFTKISFVFSTIREIERSYV